MKALRKFARWSRSLQVCPRKMAPLPSRLELPLSYRLPASSTESIFEECVSARGNVTMPWSLLGRRRRSPINSLRRRARPKPTVEPLEARCLLAIGVTELPAPGPSFGITNGPDGNVWFTELEAAKVGRISPDGVAAEFAVPGAIPAGITRGPDGNLWFAEENGNINRIIPRGTVTP